MPKPLVTQELVTSIADELHAAGIEPSILTVQGRIGAGSYTTVKRYLDQWKAQQAQRPVVEVPPEIAAKATVAIQEGSLTNHAGDIEFFVLKEELYGPADHILPERSLSCKRPRGPGQSHLMLHYEGRMRY